jgi:nucleotide-binding universal stress UspA family protein
MNFVVAVDGSDASDAALDHAVEMAGRLDATLTVVYAVDPAVQVDGSTDRDTDVGQPAGGADDAIVTESPDDAEARGERIVEAAATRASEAGLTVETELVYGDPIEAIPAFLEGTDVDGLFVGHRGLSERAEAALGSVSKALVERSPVPVTVVR